jgi:hypothetical protein
MMLLVEILTISMLLKYSEIFGLPDWVERHALRLMVYLVPVFLASIFVQRLVVLGRLYFNDTSLVCANSTCPVVVR